MSTIKRIIVGFIATILAAAGLFQAAGATGESGETTVGGFAFPETVIHDKDNDRYLVSNTANPPGAPATPGFISTVRPNGTVTNYKWIDGANASTPLDDPLGMAIYGGKLYVADITNVRVFNLNTGNLIKNIPISGVTALNDVAAYWGGVVVSDPGVDFATNTPAGTDALYKITGWNNQVSQLAAGPQLANPNGLLYDPARGMLMTSMSSPTISLINVSNGSQSSFVTLPDFGYDGIAFVDGAFYFSNPPTGNIRKVNYVNKQVSLFGTFPNFVTNIGSDTDRDRLLIPQLFSSTVIIKQL